MLRRVIGSIVVIVLFASFLSPPLRAQYAAEDIVCPSGYKVIKVAESNRVTEPFRLTFDAAGNLIAGGYGFMFFKVDPNGSPEVLGKTRKYNIDPLEVEPAPDGTYVIRSWITAPVVLYELYKFTAPNTYERVITAASIQAIGRDKHGWFYALLRQDTGSPAAVVRYDANYVPVETITLAAGGIFDFGFNAQNDLFVLVGRQPGVPGFCVLKIPSGSNGIPGPEDPQEIFASGLTDANSMAVDEAGNVYVDIYTRTETNGFSAYYFVQLTKIRADGSVEAGFGPELPQLGGLACRDGFIYASEWARGVVSRIDLATGQKTDFTKDYGLEAAGPIAFDANDDLYTHSFRQLRLLRLNHDGSFSQVGAGTGYAQTIASDGVYFYLGSADLVGPNGNQILRIEPGTGAATVLATGLGGWRTVTIDSFGRLILCSSVNEAGSLYRADIIDLMTGVATPYVTGLNRSKGMLFDSSQNIYLSSGMGDGIKKVALAKDYDPPRDLFDEPLFYDLRSGDPFPPAINYFAVSRQEEVFIPRAETGDVLMGDPSGNVEVLAQGFVSLFSATIDKYGGLYLSDGGNGIFKIVHERWTVPAVAGLKDALIEEIAASSLSKGVKTGLTKILAGVDESLLRGNRTAAIEALAGFKYAVNALAGKKIPPALAANWATRAGAFIRALKELD